MPDPTVSQDVVDLLHAATPVSEPAPPIVQAAETPLETAAPVAEALVPEAAPIIAAAVPATIALLNHVTEIESWLALLVPGQVTQGIQAVLQSIRGVVANLTTNKE